jgi:NitT/TauT family transport system permease protein
MRRFSKIPDWLRLGMIVSSLSAILSGQDKPAQSFEWLLLILAGVTIGNGISIFWKKKPVVSAWSLLEVPALILFFSVILWFHPGITGQVLGTSFWSFVISFWLYAWLVVQELSDFDPPPHLKLIVKIAIPALFGITILFLWEALVRGFNVSQILLPAPSHIWAKLSQSTSLLWTDFRQTYLKAVISGYVMGCGAGFIVAILADRVPFLRKGLLPLGNFVASLPIIGLAPIMVLWFGFDWQSKAAIVVAMVFFPMLVNTVAGLAAADSMQKDLMRTYAASYWQTLIKLRLPAAMPFIFNALKINSTLALIGAIVAEFFGSPVSGLGFRISTEVGKLNVDMVWAAIAVSALAGSLSYGALALVERFVTFWHPSIRRG